MRLPGVTPADPDDRGDGDPALVAALAAGDPNTIRTALVTARLLLPVVAIPAAGEAEMAVPNLVNADGERALPVFSSYAALRAWNDDARPVPMPGARVFIAATAEGYDGVIVDVAGPVVHTVSGAALTLLGEAARHYAFPASLDDATGGSPDPPASGASTPTRSASG